MSFHGQRSKSKRKTRIGFTIFHANEPVWDKPKPRFKFGDIPKPVLTMLFLALMSIPAIFAGSYGYYTFHIQPGLGQQDPFTTLWAGQIPSGTNTIAGITFDFASGPPNANGITCSACTSPATGFNPTTVTSGEVIVAVVDTSGLPALTLSDSQSNIYSSASTSGPIAGTGIEVFTGFIGNSGSLTWTITFTGTQSFDATFFGYKGVSSISGFNSKTAAVANSGSQSLSPTVASSFTFGHFQMVDNGAGATLTPTGTSRQIYSQGTYTPNSRIGSDDSATSTDSWTWSGAGSCSPSCDTNQIVLSFSASVVTNPCGTTGYICQNAKVVNGNVQMNPNATFPAEALSNSSIDLSTGVSKALAFSFLLSLGTQAAGNEFGYYLTLNSTLPNSAKYSPTNDTSVALAVIVNIPAANKFHYFVYMSRSIGTKLFTGTEDPAIPCTQATSLFLCATNSSASGPIAFPLVLNFTGGANGNTGPGQSYLCKDFGGGGTSCSVGGVNNQQITYNGVSLALNYSQPWINLQNNYHLGFWSRAGNNQIAFQTSTQSVQDAVISVFTPSGTGNLAEGGFFGWVGRALGGAWNFVSGGLSSVVAPALNFGNSILSSIVAAIIQGINLLIQGASTVGSAALGVLQAALNAIGNFFGWGKIGDQFFSFASGVITYFTTGLSDALNWLLRLISRSIDLIKIANNWVNFYLSGLLNFLADGLNTIVEIVMFANKITTFLGTSYVFLVTMFFLWYVADMGLGGVHAWFETMKWLAFISYDFLERMINFGISSITWVFGRIPTLDGTTLPELPTVAIGGGPIWPSTEMTAIREGNFASLFFFATGTVFLVWFETSGLPGSIGSNVTGTAAGNVAPFVTILLILVSVTSLLFVLNIPAKIARGTFGLDDLKPTSISKFSTGPLATGGVSGHFERRHPQRKARIVINRGLGASGLRPHLRKPQIVSSKPTSQGVG